MKKEAISHISDGESNIKRFGGGVFFAGANSAHGFVSYYGSILNDKKIEKLYILKGGPGTGKSSFMKRAAEYAEAHGMSVERYACASDPDSLDGVVIDGRIAVVDGTAPHTVEMENAGVRDEIVNLGAFWDDVALKKRAAEIGELTRKKHEAYRKAYRYLSAYENVCQLNSSLVAPCFLERKAKKSVERIFSGLSRGRGYRVDTGMVTAVSMKGRVRLDTYERFADKVFFVDDHLDGGHIFLRLVTERARECDMPVRVSYDPVCCDRPNAVWLCEGRVLFTLSASGRFAGETVRINMRRFFDTDATRDIRGEFRLNKRLAEALMDSALDALRGVGRYHFALEEIYSSCMDFESEGVFVRNFIETVLKR